MAVVEMENKENRPEQRYEVKIMWLNSAVFAMIHAMSIYGLYLYLTSAKIPTMISCWIFTSVGAVGVTAGAHRLWSHRSYKARLPMRVILMLMQCMAHQNSIHKWVRDHRLHHKYVDTDADPHNAQRGFFFAHMGWLIVTKHPDVQKHGRGIDMSDVANDPVTAFQKKYFYILMPLMCIVIPTLVPVCLWNENLKISFVVTILRYTMSLHLTFLFNSAAHMWGTRPYDKSISARDGTSIPILSYGEGFHNYHHAFPWDYTSPELGNYWLNMTTAFIDFFALIGLAYDLKTVPPEMVKKRALRTGDGSWQQKTVKNRHEGEVWGWNDKDMRQEDKEDTRILSNAK